MPNLPRMQKQNCPKTSGKYDIISFVNEAKKSIDSSDMSKLSIITMHYERTYEQNDLKLILYIVGYHKTRIHTSFNFYIKCSYFSL